jgi:long-chain-fatty-acid--[acyl-carrier-protein] ligase
VKGREDLCRENLDKQGGVLFLANHSAELDPVIVLMALWKRFRPRPLVLDYYYELAGFSWLMRRIRAFPVPSFQTSANRFQVKREEALVQGVAEALRKGENVLLHPSGRLKATGLEVIGGTSLAHQLLREVPKVKVVLIRTTGLWGSSFSKALMGKSPPFTTTLLQGIKTVLKNLIFFTPRRNVTVEFAVARENFPWHGSRREVNRYLENWYNQSEKEGAKGEPLQLISYSRWRKKLPKVRPVLEELKIEPVHIPREIRKEIRDVLARITGLNSSEIKDEMDLSKDLRLDSIDAADLLVFLEESHDVSGVQPQDLTTVSALMSIAAGQIVRSRKEETRELNLSFWNEWRKRPSITVPEGKTIQEVFLRSCDRMEKAVACADAIFGIMNYRRLKMGVLLLAQYFLKLPGERIGVILPASVAADMLILA